MSPCEVRYSHSRRSLIWKRSSDLCQKVQYRKNRNLTEGMLATEPAQGHFGHSNMIHTRGHVNPQPYPSTGKPVQTKQMAPPANPVQIESPQRDDNIMNRRADINSSLYQICLSLRIRLAEVPGFAPYIAEMEEEEVHIQGMSDPVTSMWNCLRRGFPLMTIYNALQPAVPLKVDTAKIGESKLGKAATFKFLQACMVEQKFAPNECFLITDLYGGDTTGFVKVSLSKPSVTFNIC